MLGPRKRCWVWVLFQSCVHCFVVVLQKCGAVCSISVHSLAVCCESDTPSHAAKPRLPPLLHLLSCYHQLLYWVSQQIVYLSCRYWSLSHVNTGLHMYTHTHTHAHTVMQILNSVTFIHRFIHGHTHTHIHACRYWSVSVTCTHRFTHAHSCMHVHIYAYINIQVHTHAHTYMVVIAGQVSTGWYVCVTTAHHQLAASLVTVQDVTPTVTVTYLVVVTGVSSGCWVCHQSTL